MEWRDDEELLQAIIEALPRLKQYKLSEPQRAFVERIGKMQIAEQQAAQSMQVG